MRSLNAELAHARRDEVEMHIVLLGAKHRLALIHHFNRQLIGVDALIGYKGFIDIGERRRLWGFCLRIGRASGCDHQ